jgi:hypothetical protein
MPYPKEEIDKQRGWEDGSGERVAMVNDETEISRTFKLSLKTRITAVYSTLSILYPYRK